MGTLYLIGVDYSPVEAIRVIVVARVNPDKSLTIILTKTEDVKDARKQD